MGTAPVTVAVVSYNTRDLLERCLLALETDARAGLAEVHVVDCASSDGSPDLVADRFPWVQLEASRENLGFGRAVNVVARRTSAPWLACANADTAVAPGALQALLDAAQRSGAEREGAWAPALVLPDGSVQHSVHAFPSIAQSAAVALGVRGRLAERWCLPADWDPNRERPVPWAIGAFLLLRRAAWNAAGGFDDSVFMYAEDLDLGWRLREAGWGTRFVPAARVLHESEASTTAAWAEERRERWQEATYRWAARRLGRRRARTIARVNIAGAAIRSRVGGEGWRRERWASWRRVHAVAAERAFD